MTTIARVLEVLTFAEHIGGDQDAQFLVGRDLVALVVAHRAEPPGDSRSGPSESPVTPAIDCDAARLQLRLEVANRVGELREDEDLLVGMLAW